MKKGERKRWFGAPFVKHPLVKANNDVALLDNISLLVNVLDGTNPDTVAKSLHKFASYGKRNKELVAELLVTLLVKLLSVKKLWAKGLCACTYEASQLSKTWDSKAYRDLHKLRISLISLKMLQGLLGKQK
ncbi:hypothetical protein KY284_036038 [Solanum tuberosum]|nr:hypothetical protein KY284_036038 [Solanum tuberosum]